MANEEQSFWPDLNLEPKDGVMVLVVRGKGEREVYFPQLGLLTEGKIEASQPVMYRSMLRARAAQSKRRE
jgi:hypothetical protein